MAQSANDPTWLIEAIKHQGVREIPGVNHHPAIVRMWKTIRRGGIKDDETPWCAAFVGFCFELVGIVSTRFESAKSYLSWGVALDHPVRGCVAVFPHHVGFLTGFSPAGYPLVLGGNQDNEVNVREIRRQPLIGLRWPAGVPIPQDPGLAVGSAPATASEA